MRWLCWHCSSFLVDECDGDCDMFPICFEDFHIPVTHYNGLWLDRQDLEELF